MEDLSARLAQAESKLVDFGNACWTHKQFTQDIQTRQYRCPEVCFCSRPSAAIPSALCRSWSPGCVGRQLLCCAWWPVLSLAGSLAGRFEGQVRVGYASTVLLGI